MSFDHGILNLPLHKRQGNIDAQVDKAKREKRKAERAERLVRSAQRARDRAKARAIVATWDEARFLRLGQRLGKTGIQARKLAEKMAYWEPTRILQLAAQEGGAP
ncbi:hypothetical protein [Pseudacidovorax sp. NFM-22]|uniref:hypothetical protein n=1 Tax=Pseudacidovorax sp. NFM-22 TaxID=2744469 RepID=UPI001F1BBFE0|nr:hypothetical protein [Pseudacidovorax sp. NFM-22]